MNDKAKSAGAAGHYEDVSATGINGLDDILCGGLTPYDREGDELPRGKR